MKKAKRFVLIFLCVVLAGMLAAGCSSGDNETPEDIENGSGTTDQPALAHEEDIVIETAYGNLYFPKQWEEYLQIDQISDVDSVEVVFSGKVNETVVPLFSIVIGGDTGNIAGVLTGADGTQRNIYVKIEENIENASLSQVEQKRFYAMQEDLNYLIDNLK